MDLCHKICIFSHPAIPAHARISYQLTAASSPPYHHHVCLQHKKKQNQTHTFLSNNRYRSFPALCFQTPSANPSPKEGYPWAAPDQRQDNQTPTQDTAPAMLLKDQLFPQPSEATAVPVPPQLGTRALRTPPVLGCNPKSCLSITIPAHGT